MIKLRDFSISFLLTIFEQFCNGYNFQTYNGIYYFLKEYIIAYIIHNNS